ncbi:hypothetical protein ACHQM5_019744 [Ranunculus cassubicifolius]
MIDAEASEESLAASTENDEQNIQGTDNVLTEEKHGAEDSSAGEPDNITSTVANEEHPVAKSEDCHGVEDSSPGERHNVTTRDGIVSFTDFEVPYFDDTESEENRLPPSSEDAADLSTYKRPSASMRGCLGVVLPLVSMVGAVVKVLHLWPSELVHKHMTLIRVSEVFMASFLLILPLRTVLSHRGFRRWSSFEISTSLIDLIHFALTISELVLAIMKVEFSPNAQWSCDLFSGVIALVACLATNWKLCRPLVEEAALPRTHHDSNPIGPFPLPNTDVSDKRSLKDLLLKKF